MINVPQSLAFEYLVFSWWPCLGKLRTYGLAGGMSLGVGFENVKMYTISSIFSDLLVCGLRRELSEVLNRHLLFHTAIMDSDPPEA